MEDILVDRSQSAPHSDESSSKMTTPSKRSVDDIVDIPDNTSTSKIRPLTKRVCVLSYSASDLYINVLHEYVPQSGGNGSHVVEKRYIPSPSFGAPLHHPIGASTSISS